MRGNKTKNELSRSITHYREMLFGKNDGFHESDADVMNFNRKERNFLLLNLLPEIGHLLNVGLIKTVMNFADMSGLENLERYISINLAVLKQQASMQNKSVMDAVHDKKPPNIHWKPPKKDYKGFTYAKIRNKLDKIIDERASGMSSFERFNRAIEDKIPDRVPFAPLMDNFYARIGNVSVAQFVSQRYSTIFKIVDFTHELFHDYFDMVHLPPGRMYSFYQPIPAAHSAYYSQLILPERKGQLLQFVEKNYLKLDDFESIRENGFASVWRPRPLGLVYETMIDFIQTGVFFYKWEHERRIPTYTGSAYVTPLECLSYLMGINEWSKCIIRRTDQVEIIADWLQKGLLANDLLLKNFSGVKRDYICLERVSPQFISPRIFERLVLPHIKEVVQQNVENGFVSLFHMDTDWEPFLHYFAELPKQGRYIYHLENTNILHAREILGDNATLMGNLDGNLLVFGTEDKIRKRVSELINKVGHNGKFILSAGCHLPPDIPIINLLVIIEQLEKLGYY